MDIDIKAFCSFIANLFPPGNFLSNMDSVMEVFSALTHNQLWNHFSCSTIESIYNEFGGGDPKLRGWIDNYKAELAGFKATTKIINYIREWNCEEDIADSEQSIAQYRACYDKDYCIKLAIKLKRRITEKSLEYIDEFWRSIADLFLLPSLLVLLKRIKEGCTEITWLVSPEIASLIESAVLNEDSHLFLRQVPVMRITLDGRTLYATEVYQLKDVICFELVCV